MSRGRAARSLCGLALIQRAIAFSKSISSLRMSTSIVSSSRGVSVESAISHQEAVHMLQGGGFMNADIGEMLLAPGLELEMDGLAARLSQMQYLIDIGVMKEKTIKDLMVCQPQFLEQRFLIVHEDDSYIVMNKPADTRLSLGKENTPNFPRERTCAGWLRENRPDMDKLRFCHQLDSGTSGILLIAKSKKAGGDTARLFRERKVMKEYTALVYGWPTWETTTVNAAIKPSTDGTFHGSVEESTINAVGVQEASTDMHVLEKGRLCLPGHPRVGEPVSLLKVMPFTGRRHQIRLHCKHIGHPIVGDLAYADDLGAYRMFLHASRLVLPISQDVKYDLSCPHNFGHAFTKDD